MNKSNMQEAMDIILMNLRQKDVDQLLKIDKKDIEKVFFQKDEKGSTMIHFIQKELRTLSFILSPEKELIEIQEGRGSLKASFKKEQLSESQMTSLEKMLEEYITFFNLRLRLLLS